MSCEKVQEQISLMLDRQEVSPDWEQSQQHMQACRHCDAHFEALRNMHAGLRYMAHPPVPSGLTARLRVAASHDRARRASRVSLSARVRDWAGNLRLFSDNLMRPFAVPVTGGLFTALLLFSIVMPSLTFRRSVGYEPPIAVLTDPEGEIVGAGLREWVRLESGDATISGNEVSLVLLIDERGHVQDYYLSGGELTYEMKSLILLSRFTPATIYGQPTWGLKQVVFQHSNLRLRS
jgi:hypothetical protein